MSHQQVGKFLLHIFISRQSLNTQVHWKALVDFSTLATIFERDRRRLFLPCVQEEDTFSVYSQTELEMVYSFLLLRELRYRSYDYGQARIDRFEATFVFSNFLAAALRNV